MTRENSKAICEDVVTYDWHVQYKRHTELSYTYMYNVIYNNHQTMIESRNLIQYIYSNEKSEQIINAKAVVCSNIEK